MSTLAKLSGAEFDAMVLRGAFACIEPIKVELIHGELRFMNPASPIHDDLIEVADSSLEGDLREKADIYAEAGIQEYWEIDVNSARIHVLSESDGHTFRRIEIVVAPTPRAPRCLSTATLDIRELFEVL